MRKLTKPPPPPDPDADHLLGKRKRGRPPQKRKRGRPPFAVTPQKRRLVEAMTANGIPRADIANVLQCSLVVLKTKFKAELETGKAKAITLIGQRVVDIALGKSASIGEKVPVKVQLLACQFWLRFQGGWREAPSEHRFAGPDGGPIPLGVGPASAPSSDEQRGMPEVYARLSEALAKRAKDRGEGKTIEGEATEISDDAEAAGDFSAGDEDRWEDAPEDEASDIEAAE